MAAPVQDSSRTEPERYEPLPGVTGIPRWVWRRLPPAGKVGLALLPVVIVALVIALGPGIDESKDERRQAEAERQAEARAERIAALRAEQRPRFGSGPAAGTDLAARASLLSEAAAAVRTDARRRVAPVRSTARSGG